MSVIRADAFDQYQGDVAAACASAIGLVTIDAATSGSNKLVQGDARTGEWYGRSTGFNEVLGRRGFRYTLPSPESEVFLNFAVRFPGGLPTGTWTGWLMRAFDNTGTENDDHIVALSVNGTGQIVASSGNLSSLTTIGTSAAVIFNNSWQHIAVRIVRHASTGIVTVRVDGNEVLHITGLNLGSADIGNVVLAGPSSSIGDGEMHLDDVVFNNTSGARNNTWMGQPRVAYTSLRRDDPDEDGWGNAHARLKYSVLTNGLAGGALIFDGAGDAVTAPDGTNFELGSGDFTAEGWFKFTALPGSTNSDYLFGKYQTGSNQRSYALRYDDNDNRLKWSVSVDGTNVIDVVEVPWEPLIGFWYHIAVVRDSGQTTIFIDGLRSAAPQADANTYFDGTALFSLGNIMSAASTVDSDEGFTGYIDEFRLTKGVARYSVSFVKPSAAFPRDVGGDADFASVSLLVGADTSVADESSNNVTLTARGGAARISPGEDLPGSYKSLNTYVSDSFVAGDLIAATNTLTFGGQPSGGDTVTLDGETYTFEAAFTDTANNVLIGATVQDTVNNLVAAINSEAGEGTVYGTGTVGSVSGFAFAGDENVFFQALNPGVAGNAIVTTSVGSNLIWEGGGTCTGGKDLPDPSSFYFNRLPQRTTNVRAALLFGRMAKSDGGDAQVQMSFVTADESSANGADRAISTSFTYYGDVIETDPSTSGALTPGSFIGAKIRVDRTV